MDDIALLQFHREFDVCAARIELLRHFNPSLRIFGLFGGKEADIKDARRLERVGLEHLFPIKGKDPAWNRKHTDLAVRLWFTEFGRHVEFERLYVIQWDLLFFDALPHVYRGIPPGALGLTGLCRLDEIAHRWSWTRIESQKAGSEALLEIARARFGFRGDFRACLGPGYCLPRAFLEAYADIGDVPEAGHDELRLPLFGELLGFPLEDTGFYPQWFARDQEGLFNANDRELDVGAVGQALAQPDGRRAFHPCRSAYPAATLRALLGDLRP